MDAAVFLADVPPRPARQVLSTWLVEAWRVFRRAPVRIFALSLLPILFEAMLQLLPGAGVVLSKLLTPLAGAWVLALLDQKVRGGAFAPALASRRWSARLPALVPVSLLCAAVFVLQLLVAAGLGGFDQARALAVADVAGMRFSRIELGAVLALGSVPGALLMFLMPRVLLDGVAPIRALLESVRQVLRYWRAVAMATSALAVLLFVAVWQVPWLLLPLFPVGLVLGYASYRDVFDRARAG